MARSRVALIAALVATLGASAGSRAQMPPISAMKGEVGLGLLLRQLKTTAVLMQAVAHPDDENNGMLAATGLGPGRAHGGRDAPRAATAARTRSARNCSTRSP